MQNNERSQFQFPSVVLQFLDRYFEPEKDQDKLRHMLDYFSVTEEQFRDPWFRFNGEQVYVMLSMLRKASVYEPPSLRVLRHLSVSTMGMAGIAGLTAMTLQEAYDVVLQFHKVVMPVLELVPSHEGEFMRLEAKLLADFEDCEGTLLELIVGALKQFTDEATGTSLDARLEFAHSPEWGADRDKTILIYRQYFNCDVRFNRDTSAIVFRKSELSKRLKNPNKVLHSIAREAVNEELALTRKPDTLTDRVRRMLAASLEKGAALKLEEVAAELHMTSRTLARKLAREDTQFKALLNEVRFEKAKRLLEEKELSIKQMASRLGFTNADTFSRAFKKHTGVTPNQWVDER